PTRRRLQSGLIDTSGFQVPGDGGSAPLPEGHVVLVRATRVRMPDEPQRLPRGGAADETGGERVESVCGLLGKRRRVECELRDGHVAQLDQAWIDRHRALA